MSEEPININAEEAEEGKKKRKPRTKRIQMAGISTDLASYLRDQRVWNKLFVDNIADFAAFDATFTNTYATDWRSTIDELTAHPQDFVMLADLAQKTQDVLEIYRKAGQLADDLEYFVKKAFPDDERKLDEFGFRLLNSVSHATSLKFTLYAQAMLRIAQEYQPKLSAAGLPASWFTDFESAVMNGANAEVAQELAKRYRIRATTQRIKLANRLHSYSARVSKAAKIIYRQKPETAKIWENT